MNGKNVIVKFSLVIIVIVVAFLGYRFFFAGTPSPSGLVGLAPAGVSTTNRASSDEFVALLSSLQAINLNDLPRVLSLLSGLEDFSTNLEPQTPGRANPFAPIGIGKGPSVETIATTTSTSTKK